MADENGDARTAEDAVADTAGSDSSPVDSAEAVADTEGTTAGNNPLREPEKTIASSDATANTTSRILLWGSAALAVAAFAVAAVFGVMWWIAATGEGTPVAEAREDVTKAASNAVTAFTELDYENTDEYFERQKAVAAEEFRDEIVELEDVFTEAITEAETKVVSTIQDVGVSELNEHEGSASVLVTVRNEVTQGDEEAVKYLRLEAQMTRTEDDQEWKLAGVAEVPPVAGHDM